jgi:predicted ATPase with chaperone activity
MTARPGAGKSLLAACLPGILPDLTAAEAWKCRWSRASPDSSTAAS